VNCLSSALAKVRFEELFVLKRTEDGLDHVEKEGGVIYATSAYYSHYKEEEA
jgi:hypothetical protein